MAPDRAGDSRKPPCWERCGFSLNCRKLLNRPSMLSLPDVFSPHLKALLRLGTTLFNLRAGHKARIDYLALLREGDSAIQIL